MLTSNTIRRLRGSAALRYSFILASLWLMVYVMWSGNLSPNATEPNRVNKYAGRGSTSSGNQAKNAQGSVDSNHKIAFVGIFSTAERLQRRALIRATYLQLAPSTVDVRFIVGTPKTSEYKTLVELESQRHGDIVILSMTENMDDGKTFAYFDHIAHHAERHYDYVLKVDDDTWLHLPNMIKWISEFPKDGGIYFGRDVPNTGFMAGMGYGLSWDLVEWIGKDDYPRQHRIGQEDATLAGWLRYSKKLKHYISDTTDTFYDDPSSSGGWRHEYTANTILIHRLKEERPFLRATQALMPKQFNITRT